MMKKALIFFLILVCALALVACDDVRSDRKATTSGDTDKQTAATDTQSEERHAQTEPPTYDPVEGNVIFAPTETPNARNADLFWENLPSMHETEYAHYTQYRDTTTVYNYAPTDIIDRYGFNAFAVKDNAEDVHYAPTSYFIYYDGKLYDLYNYAPDFTVHGFVHFALADVNRDGYAEVYTSLNRYRPDKTGDANYTMVYIHDSRTGKNLQYTKKDRSVYFKQTAEGALAIYTTDSDSYKLEPISCANTLSDTLLPNPTRYLFDRQTFEVECETFRATVIVDEDTLSFPVHPAKAPLHFSITTEMTYLGAPYDEVAHNKAGATIRLLCGQSEINSSADWGYPETYTYHYDTNEVVTRTYHYYVHTEAYCAQYAIDYIAAGTYHAIIGFHGVDAPVVANVLTVAR